MRKNVFKYTWVVLILIAASAFLVYSNTIKAEFHFDDMTSIIVQSRITSFKTFSDINYWLQFDNRPVSDLTFALNYHFGQRSGFRSQGLLTLVHGQLWS